MSSSAACPCCTNQDAFARMTVIHVHGRRLSRPCTSYSQSAPLRQTAGRQAYLLSEVEILQHALRVSRSVLRTAGRLHQHL